MHLFVISYIILALLQGCSRIEDNKPSLKKKIPKVVDSKAEEANVSSAAVSQTSSDSVATTTPRPEYSALDDTSMSPPEQIHKPPQQGDHQPMMQGIRSRETHKDSHPNLTNYPSVRPSNQPASHTALPSRNDQPLGQVYPPVSSTTRPEAIQPRRRPPSPEDIQEMSRNDRRRVVTTTPRPRGLLTDCCLGACEVFGCLLRGGFR